MKNSLSSLSATLVLLPFLFSFYSAKNTSGKSNSLKHISENNLYSARSIDTTKKVKKVIDTVKTDSVVIIDTKVELLMDKDTKTSREKTVTKNANIITTTSNASAGRGAAQATVTSSGGSNNQHKKTNTAEAKKEMVVQKHLEKQKMQLQNTVQLSSPASSSNAISLNGQPADSKADKNKSANGAQEIKAGLMTGGETNDLSKWNLWNDMVKTALDAQINLWKIHPYNRYTVLLQTKSNMPVQGARVSLVNNSGNVLWEAITDNTGTAQLWKNIYRDAKDTSVAEIKIEYKGIKESIKKPIDYFHGVNTKTLKTSYEKPEIVDIAFVVDATGSMSDEIKFLKEEMNDIIGKTQKKYENIDLYLGSLFYKCKGNSYVTKHTPLTQNHNQVIDFIKERDASEGGTEAVETALEVSIAELNWHDNARTRLLFLVLDEPSGYHDTIIQKLHKQIQLAAKKGIKIIPVVASGGAGLVDQRNLEYLMRASALATNGNYIFITNHSGIGNNHTEPIIDNYEVELINDIITRTIENNIYMPDEKSSEEEITKDTLLIDNKKDFVSKYLDSLSESMSETELMTLLLPFTHYTSIEEMKEDRPLKKIDTAAFLAAQKKKIHTLKVFPNPSNGYLKAEFNTEVDWLYIADLSGKIIQRLASNGKNLINVDLTAFPNGIYLIQYLDKDFSSGTDGKWISAKIVLQK